MEAMTPFWHEVKLNRAVMSDMQGFAFSEKAKKWHVF
jgi:hypothetical protein